MELPEPLQGFELIDCAKANENKGITIAAQRCGYGDDLATFERELKKACEAIGVEIQNFDTLANHTQAAKVEEAGIEIAPDTPDQL